jgi:hypothetical protein
VREDRPAPPRVPRRGAPVSRRLVPINYTTQRALRALEVLAFVPSGASEVAAALAVHPRTARRTLATLTSDGYLERSGAPRAVYRPTVRLLALASQLAERLPLVIHGREVVRRLADELGVGVALAVPSYEQVLKRRRTPGTFCRRRPPPSASHCSPNAPLGGTAWGCRDLPSSLAGRLRSRRQSDTNPSRSPRWGSMASPVVRRAFSPPSSLRLVRSPARSPNAPARGDGGGCRARSPYSEEDNEVPRATLQRPRG